MYINPTYCSAIIYVPCFFAVSYNVLLEWPFNSLQGSLHFHSNRCCTVFDMTLMGCMGELDPPVLLQKWEMGGWEGGGGGVKVLGADRVSCPQAQLGAVGVSGRSYVQGENRQGCRNWAITLFGLQASYLFARFDMFLSTGGAVQYGKPIALKCIYLFCRRRSQTEQGWKEELEIRTLESTQRKRQSTVFQRVGPFTFVPACYALSPVELWMVERTRPPSASAISRTTTRCWLLTNGEMSCVFIHDSAHNHNHLTLKKL